MAAQLRYGIPLILVSLLLVVGAARVYPQTSRNQSTTVLSQQELSQALLDKHNEASGDVGALLDANSKLLSRALWQVLIDEAVRSYHEQDSDRAFFRYDIARQIALKLDDQELISRTWYYIGRSYSGVNQFGKAQVAYEESRQAFARAGLQRDLIYILSDLGTLSFIQEDYSSAREYSEASLKLAESLKSSVLPTGGWPDIYGVASAYNTLGELSAREGNISEGLEYLLRSLTLYLELNNGSSTYDYFIAEVYASMGRVYTAAGDYVKALGFLNKALVISKSTRNQDQEASVLNSIGFLYMEQEDYAQAREKFQRSLTVYRVRKNQREESRVLLNLGVIEQRQGNYDEAIVRFRHSLDAAKASGNTDVQIAAGEGIGVALGGKRESSTALQVLNESLTVAKDINDKTRQAELLWRSAEIHLAMSDYAQSTEFSQIALTLADELHAPKLTYLATTTLGQSYAAQNKPELAIQTLKAAIEQVEVMRHQVAGLEQSRQLFFENKISSYHSLIELLVEQGKVFEALRYAEQAKGRVLFDISRRGRVDITKNLTATERAEVLRLHRRIFEINDRIRVEKSEEPTSLESLYQQLDAARLEYGAFQGALYAKHPDFRLRSGHTPTLTKADLNELATSQNVYLEYVVTAERVYVFVLTNNAELSVYPLSVRPLDLESKVDRFHQRLANRHPDFVGLARELYLTLIEPVRNHIRGESTLCIIPDGFLWNLPFQALITDNSTYMVQEHPIYYALSLSLLRQITKAAVETNRPSSVIAFGNPVVGRDEQRNRDLCPLPEAETEVTSISKILDSNPHRVFIGRLASEKTFKALAPTYINIHLATHGVVDNRNPLYSRLLLTRTEGDTENDGLLEAHEIMNMNLKADLAVLSACETANGRIAPGEGVMGLSWAFFVAGTRSTLVTQWRVNSLSTSKLMQTIYGTLKQKNSSESPSVSKARALQEAAVRLMKDQRYRHPFYWAAFVIVGNGM